MTNLNIAILIYFYVIKWPKGDQILVETGYPLNELIW
jgi:hypothetical protein